jgi:hypothetical protein
LSSGAFTNTQPAGFVSEGQLPRLITSARGARFMQLVARVEF